MKLERVRNDVYIATLHAVELSALVAAARMVLEEGERLPSSAVHQLTDAVRSYDSALARLNSPEPELRVKRHDQLTKHGD